jgi:hypothetical protein
MVGDIKFEEAPESIRVVIAAWFLVYMSISRRGDILDFETQTNSILVHSEPIRALLRAVAIGPTRFPTLWLLWQFLSLCQGLSNPFDILQSGARCHDSARTLGFIV